MALNSKSACLSCWHSHDNLNDHNVRNPFIMSSYRVSHCSFINLTLIMILTIVSIYFIGIYLLH